MMSDHRKISIEQASVAAANTVASRSLYQLPTCLLALILSVCVAASSAAAACAIHQDGADDDSTEILADVMNGEEFEAAAESPYDEPLVTDRPDFTEASSTVGQGVIQLETGYTFFYNDDDTTGDKTRTHTTPEVLLRLGISDSVELRLAWTYVWEEMENAGVLSQRDGGSDIGIGAKIELREQCCWIPEQAILIGGSVPAGADSFSSDEVEVGVNYLYSWELADEWSLAGSSGFFTFTDASEDFVVLFQAVALGIPINDCLGMYVEYFGLYETNRATNTDQHFLNGGFAYLWNYDVQFDIRAGMGLNDDAEDFFNGAGASFRF